MNTLEFFQSLYPEKPEGAILLIWTVQDKVSRYFTDLKKATDYALGLPAHDVYFEVCLGRKAKGPSSRFKMDDIYAVPGLWADIDFSECDAHKKVKLYPRDRGEAQKILNDLPMKPSIIVNSGHGLHCYWLFKELFLIESEEDSMRIRTASEKWKQLIQEAARSHGFELDSVSDLARILRVPGTMNRKSTPIMVTVEDESLQPGGHGEPAIGNGGDPGQTPSDQGSQGAGGAQGSSGDAATDAKVPSSV